MKMKNHTAADDRLEGFMGDSAKAVQASNGRPVSKYMDKVGAIILNSARDKMIVVRKTGKAVFIIPGGKPEGHETDIETLRRELKEELQVGIGSCSFFGEYEERAEFDDAVLRMRVYEVLIVGTPNADSEIEEATWIDRTFEKSEIKIGSVLRNHVVPALVTRGDL